MITPNFKIKGKPRRELKKELSLLNHSIKMFWWHVQGDDDMYSFIGQENPHKKEDTEADYDRLCKKRDELLTKVNEVV